MRWRGKRISGVGERDSRKHLRSWRERFTTEPVLVTPDLDKEIRVEADASDFAMGGMLSMKYEDKRWRLVAYISKSLNEAERNYEIHDKEMLAIIWCLEAWRHFLERSQGSVWNMDRSQELRILYEGPKVESKAGKMVTVLVKIWFCLETCSWQKYGKSRQFE